MEVNVVWRRAAVSDEGKPAPITRCLAVARPFHLLDSHILVGTDDGIVSFLPLFSAAQVRNYSWNRPRPSLQIIPDLSAILSWNSPIQN